MNRRDFMANSAFAAAASALPCALARDKRTVSVTIGGFSRHSISPGFLGLVYEISSVARRGLLSNANRVYVQLVRTPGTRSCWV